MRTLNQTNFYCVHCGFDVQCEGVGEDQECPARDGDLCFGQRRQPKDSAGKPPPRDKRSARVR